MQVKSTQEVILVSPHQIKDYGVGGCHHESPLSIKHHGTPSVKPSLTYHQREGHVIVLEPSFTRINFFNLGPQPLFPSVIL